MDTPSVQQKEKEQSMTGADILSLVTGAYDLLKISVVNVFGYLSKGKVDKTEELRLKSQYDMAVQQYQFAMRQAEMWLAEKMLVGARWTYPLAMLSGCSIVAVCLFNIVTRTMGWAVRVEMFSWEFICLIGMFLLSATGSAEILIKLAMRGVDKLEKVDGTKPKPDVDHSSSK